MDAFGNERLLAEDFVGWTVTANENSIPDKVLYCVSVLSHGSIQLSDTPARDPNLDETLGVNWWAKIEHCTRLRQGDFGCIDGE